MNIFVARLHSGTTADDLKSLFEQYGEVKFTKVVRDHETGFSKRYGFVEMENQEEALQAIEALNDSDFQGSKIVVKVSEPREPRGGRGGAGRKGEDNY